MRCEKVMKHQIASVSEDDSVQRAALLMREENVGFLPVLDEEGRVIGAITDRDIAIRVCAEDGGARETPIGDVMTREVVACGPNDDLAHAESLMSLYRKSRLMVVSGEGQLLGVISLSDIVERDSNRHAARTLRKIVSREYRF